jgi:hypothetical protein
MACWPFPDWVKWAKVKAIPYFGWSIDGVMEPTDERLNSAGVRRFTRTVRKLYDRMKIGGTPVGIASLTMTLRPICFSQI